MPDSMRRFGLFLIAVIQLAMPSWTAIADAHTLGPNPTDQVHIEPDGCVPSHPLDCRLCGYDRLPVHGGLETRIHAPAVLAIEAERPATNHLPDSFSAPAALPRAPPIQA